MTKRKVVHTRHVLAVKDLKVEAAYYVDKLGFDRDFTAPGWEFLSFGDFKVMLGECSDEMTAEATGNHSWFAHALTENVDEVIRNSLSAEQRSCHRSKASHGEFANSR
jgi:hypothetical protein